MDNPTITINIFAALGGIIAAVIAGGGLSLAAFTIIVNRLNSDVATQDAIEALAKSLPPEALTEVRAIIKLVQDGAALASKVTDGLPNEPAVTPASVDRQIGAALIDAGLVPSASMPSGIPYSSGIQGDGPTSPNWPSGTIPG